MFALKFLKSNMCVCVCVHACMRVYICERERTIFKRKYILIARREWLKKHTMFLHKKIQDYEDANSSKTHL